ncbi:hypothetical protein ACCO45_003971 [Purpureocillium lilacinum]|uniref:Uncharacterized protein n=1 Tax=Purpureocillium lilacinum TaxID=33203 RepID=A0ACC4E2J6_PURLI
MWAPQVVTSTSIRACWSARARSLGLCTRRILVVGLKPRASTGCRSGAPGLAVQAQVSCGLDTGSHRPRCFGGPTGCPLAGPCLRRVQGSGPYRLQVSDLRRRLTDRASEVSAQPDQTQGFVHARQELPDSQLLDSGYRFLILLPPPTGGADQAGRLAGAAQRSAPGLGTFCLPRRPSALHCAYQPPLPLPKLGRTNSSPPPSPVLRPARARALFGAPCLSQRNPRHSCCIVSCRVRAAPAIPLPGFGGRVPVLNSRHGSWRTQRSKPSIAPARLWLIPALQELGSRPHRAVETRAPMASYGLAGGTARQVNCLQQAAGEDIHARKWTRHETCQLLPDDACT